MGTQGEIYVVLGKRFLVKRVDPNPEISEDPSKLLYNLNDRIISISEDRPECHFLDGFTGIRPLNLKDPILGVKVLGVDHEYGDRNFNRPLVALVGYAVANESYSAHATVIPSIEEILPLRSRLVNDIEKQIGLTIPLTDLHLHLLFEFVQ